MSAMCLRHVSVRRRHPAHALDDRLAGRERGRDAAAGLDDLVLLAGDLLRLDSAVVLVAPDDQIHRVVEAVLRHGRLGHVRDAARSASVCKGLRAPVLMDDEQVEVLLGVDSRAEHGDAVATHLGVEALVTDVADAVQGELGLASALRKLCIAKKPTHLRSRTGRICMPMSSPSAS